MAAMVSGVNSSLAVAEPGRSHKALWQAAEQFEAIFVKQLLGQMEASRLGPDGLSGPGAGIYRGMLDQQLAGKIATRDPFGLARLLVEQMGHPGDNSSAAITAKAALPVSADTGASPLAEQARRFADKLLPSLKKAAAKLHTTPRVLLAQAALETGWGRHVPHTGGGSSTFNVFGVKTGPGWTGKSVSVLTHEYRNGKPQKLADSFRAYPDLESAIRDFVGVAGAMIPPLAEGESVTAERWGSLLMQGGYATDPDYVRKLQAVAGSPLMHTALEDTPALSSSDADVPYRKVSPR